MKLETRKPLLALLGAWNPAIFSPNWVALHLLGYKEGTTVQFFMAQPERMPLAVTYIDDIGYMAANNRVDLFLKSFNSDSFSHLSALVQKIISTLPHTPFGNFGVNFSFVEDEPAAEIYDALRTTDNIHHKFKVISQEFNTKIAFRAGCELNFKRVPAEEAITFDFNYHHQLAGAQTYEILTAEYFQELLNQSTSILKELYGLEGYEELSHEFANPETQGETP